MRYVLQERGNNMSDKFSKNENRSVLLLIPELDSYINDKRIMKEITLLRREINYCVNDVMDILDNQLIKEFVGLENILCERGIPQIKLSTIDNNPLDNCSNIRICLTKFNRQDFYDGSKYNIKPEENNISHLIELHISENYNRITWKASERKDEDGDRIFDVTVITPLKLLKRVILSIMLDIYSYYIIGLSSDFNHRREFSINKVKYLENSFGKTELREKYHLNTTTHTKNIYYLPVSIINEPSYNGLNLDKTVRETVNVVKETMIMELQKSHKLYDLIVNKLDSFEETDFFFAETKSDDINDKESLMLKLKNYTENHKNIKIHYIKQDKEISFLCCAGINDILLFYPFFNWYKISYEKDLEDKTL